MPTTRPNVVAASFRAGPFPDGKAASAAGRDLARIAIDRVGGGDPGVIAISLDGDPADWDRVMAAAASRLRAEGWETGWESGVGAEAVRLRLYKRLGFYLRPPAAVLIVALLAGLGLAMAASLWSGAWSVLCAAGGFALMLAAAGAMAGAGFWDDRRATGMLRRGWRAYVSGANLWIKASPSERYRLAGLVCPAGAGRAAVDMDAETWAAMRAGSPPGAGAAMPGELFGFRGAAA